MKFIIIFSSLCTTVFSELKTVDVGPILDIDLTLYKLTYDKDKGQSLRNFPEKDGFSASQVMKKLSILLSEKIILNKTKIQFYL